MIILNQNLLVYPINQLRHVLSIASIFAYIMPLLSNLQHNPIIYTLETLILKYFTELKAQENF